MRYLDHLDLTAHASFSSQFRFIPVSLVSFYYGFLFATSVGITIVLPQVFEKPPYHFSSTAVGASYLALGVGSILGKAFGGEIGDKTMSYMQKRHGGHREPEYRLWALVGSVGLYEACFTDCGDNSYPCCLSCL